MPLMLASCLSHEAHHRMYLRDAAGGFGLAAATQRMISEGKEEYINIYIYDNLCCFNTAMDADSSV